MPEALRRRAAWRRHWRALLLAIPGAGFGLAFGVICSQPSPKCIAVIAPSELAGLAMLGAVGGVVVAVLVMLVAVAAEKQNASFAQRFPDSLVFAAFADELTRSAAAALGVNLIRGAFTVVVSRQGMQFWSGLQATRLKIDVTWSELGTAVLGEPSGDMSKQFGSGYGLGPWVYPRVSIEVTSNELTGHLQFPVSSAAGSNVGPFCDAYDLRRLVRQINGYKSVHDRSALGDGN